MLVPDAFRSQLYLRRLRHGLQDLAAALSGLRLQQDDADAAVEGLGNTLAGELDSIVLPTVALELAIARGLGLLTGTTPQQRYESFFATGGGWQPWARAILPRYGILDELISSYIDSTIAAVREAMERLCRDGDAVRRAFLGNGERRLRGFRLAGEGDRHRNGRRVLWFRFDRGATVMYKPTDVGAYRLFERFFRWLDLGAPQACYLPRVLRREGFGWMEFVPHLECQSHEDVRRFFLRSGVLLAVAEALHLTDGHAGNLVARGSHPVLVDLETLLHNNSLSFGGGHPGILGTLLVQRPRADGALLGISAGLMCAPVAQYETLGAHARNERTDVLSVTFGRPGPEAPCNLPKLGHEHVPVHGHVEDVVAGYTTGYEIISERLRSAHGPPGWLHAASTTRPRIVVRPTIYYVYLLRLLEQPEALVSRQGAETALRGWLSRTGKYWECEVYDLLRRDVPYFFQVPDERHLYSSTGDREENVFPVSAVRYLTEAWRRRSRRHRDQNAELLRELLPQSPTSHE